MFSRIKDAIRIITYREPVVHGPDTLIVEHAPLASTVAGRRIAKFAEFSVALYLIAHVSGPITKFIEHQLGKPSASTTTVAVVGAVVMFIANALREDIEAKLRSHIKLADSLAPFFGKRMHNSFRVLKG